MKSILFILMVYVFTTYDSYSQIRSQAVRDSLAKLSQADFDLMKQQLGITTANRPGPSGNPSAPNAANRDESKVGTYTLPDPLVLKNGKKVKNADQWWKKRRPEIVEDFESEMIGRIPANVPSVSWKVLSVRDTVVGTQAIKEKMLLGVVDNSSYPAIKVEIQLQLATPMDAKGPVPVVLSYGRIQRDPGITAIGLGSATEPSYKEQLIMRGWGYATIVPTSFQADHGGGFREGIIGLVNKGGPRKPDDWGTLRAWAWGCARAIDYFESDKDVDAKRLAIEGLSRYGKATAVTMAFEQRFSLGFIGSAGSGGTKLLRRLYGQQVENITSHYEGYWFCGNFIKYGTDKTVYDLPVDGHSLVALCAPRPIFISSGSPQIEGEWIDAKGMFLGGVHGSPVYKLLGKKGMETDQFPPIGTPLVAGDVAWRQHAGGHSTGPNWSTWIAWACKFWGDCKYK
jgi:hypothetical protein